MKKINSVHKRREIRIYDSLSGTKQDLPNSRPIRFFVCGPTVYDFPHLGHARTYIAFDTIVRYLRSQKIKISYLQNITDVDDKIIERAKEQNISPIELAAQFEREYHKAEKILHIKGIKYAKATKHIPQIIKQIQTLIKKGHAYKIDNDGYYFDISTFPEYGKLSKRTVLQAEDATSRIDETINKRNKGDFALWKFPTDKTIPELNPPAGGNKKIAFKIVFGEPLWHTSLGWGRPGWHIEDTAITEHYYGPQYDIHGGGVDLKFPHHEAEITQQESASGKKPMVKIWMHAGFLLINGKKMSKSLKNFITINDFIAKYPPETLRLLINQNHYRSPFNYMELSADQANNTLKKIQKILAILSMNKIPTRDTECRSRGSSILINKIGTKEPDNIEIKKALSAAELNFKEAMDDDFNTPKALASIFELINAIEPNICKLNKKEAVAAQKFIISKMELFLGIVLKTPKMPSNIAKLAKERELCRNHKQFAQSDLLRNKIESLGYIVEDMPSGPLISKK